jgi:uncharacterized protein YlxW (UPF0749 family)
MTRMPAQTRPHAPARPDASMTLLTGLMDNALDEGYAQAAARRAAGEARPARASWLLLVGLVAVGMLLATAAAQVRSRAPAAAEARAALASEIQDRTAVADRLERDLDRLRASVSAARTDGLRLTTEGTRLAGRLARLEAAAGAAAVVGPALAIHLEDAPDEATADGTDPRADSESQDGRLTDRDLQTVVNEVWGAGAEAVAVNGQRLTSVSAIRSAGDAILVDFRPLSPPYDIVAIGDPDAMRTAFAEGFGGSYLQALEGYGIESRITEQDEARLGPSAGVVVRYATTPEKAQEAE